MAYDQQNLTFFLQSIFCTHTFLQCKSLIKYLNFSLQNEAMRVGMLSILISCLSAFLMGRFTDRFYGHVKKSLLLLMLIATCAFVWFLILSVYKDMPPYKCKYNIIIIFLTFDHYFFNKYLFNFLGYLQYRPSQIYIINEKSAFICDSINIINIIIINKIELVKRRK